MSLPALPPGTTINKRYELRRKLGSDGVVYEAHDRHLDKLVAVKLLEPVEGQAQSWDEAQRLERLRSRFLVEIINADVVIESDIRFIVTPLLNAGDLEAACPGTGLCLSEAVRYMQQVASGIDRIHDAGMVHRDIKPANVLQDGDEVLVSDLEYCELLGPDGRATRNGSWCTLAPEAAPDDGYCSVASDIYSLGATTFYLLSGQYPVDHTLPRAEQRKLIEAGAARDVRDLAPHVSQALGTVVRKALSTDPSRRFHGVLDFSNALVHAARNTRNWRRVLHEGHVHCLQGDPFKNKIAVTLCCIQAERGVDVRARYLPTRRRVPGVPDGTSTSAALPKTLQRFVKALS